MGARAAFLCCLIVLWWCRGEPVFAVSADNPASTTPTPATPPKILAFGDSLTAGPGVSREEAYPAQLQKRLDKVGLRYQVVNAGVSGETTAGGLRRVPWVLNGRPTLVILELGANDGLRGLSLEQTRANLEAIIRRFRDAQVEVVLAGMKLPPNYGTEYTQGFEGLFPALARQYRLSLIPFFLAGVAARPELNQADGIHPTAEGYRLVADTVFATLQPLLEARASRRPDRQDK